MTASYGITGQGDRGEGWKCLGGNMILIDGTSYVINHGSPRTIFVRVEGKNLRFYGPTSFRNIVKAVRRELLTQRAL